MLLGIAKQCYKRYIQHFNENGNLMLELNYSFTFCNIYLHTQQITIFRMDLVQIRKGKFIRISNLI